VITGPPPPPDPYEQMLKDEERELLNQHRALMLRKKMLQTQADMEEDETRAAKARYERSQLGNQALVPQSSEKGKEIKDTTTDISKSVTDLVKTIIESEGKKAESASKMLLEEINTQRQLMSSMRGGEPGVDQKIAEMTAVFTTMMNFMEKLQEGPRKQEVATATGNLSEQITLLKTRHDIMMSEEKFKQENLKWRMDVERQQKKEEAEERRKDKMMGIFEQMGAGAAAIATSLSGEVIPGVPKPHNMEQNSHEQKQIITQPCPDCQGDLKFNYGETEVICPGCNTTHTINYEEKR